MKMKNDYKAGNVVEFISDFVKQEERFDSIFFERLSCMFTTVALMCDVDVDTYVCDTLIAGLWEDVKANYDENLTKLIKDYDVFYDWMVKWIV